MTAGVGPAVADVRPLTWWDGLRWLLFAAWVLIMVVGVATMARWSTYEALRHDLDHGVSHVTVAGQAGEQEVRWRAGGLNHKVRVGVPRTQVSDFSDDENTAARDVGEELQAEHPGLKVSRANLEETGQQGTTVKIGFRISMPFDGDVGYAATILLVLSVVLIVFGPQPWWATKWAWFWLLGVPYLGLPAMLLLSGPTRWVPPDSTRNRLTGGKAFLFAAVTYTLASLLGWA